MILDDVVLATFNHYSGGAILAIDFESGDELWRFERTTINQTVIDRGEIYVTTYHSQILRLDRSGTILWEVMPVASGLAQLALTETALIYAATGDGASMKATRALSREDGSVLWEYDHGGSPYSIAVDSGRVVHTVIATERNHYAGTSTDEVTLHCLDAETGGPLWVVEREQDPTLNYGQWMFSSTIDGDYVFIGSRSEVRVYNVITGEFLGSFLLDDPLDAVRRQGEKVRNGVVLLADSGRLFCLTIEDPNQIRLVWDHPSSSIIQTYSIVDDEILAITEGGSLLSIDPSDGTLLSSDQIPGPFKKGFGLASKNGDLILAVAPHCRRVSR